MFKFNRNSCHEHDKRLSRFFWLFFRLKCTFDLLCLPWQQFWPLIKKKSLSNPLTYPLLQLIDPSDFDPIKDYYLIQFKWKRMTRIINSLRIKSVVKIKRLNTSVIMFLAVQYNPISSSSLLMFSYHLHDLENTKIIMTSNITPFLLYHLSSQL